VSYSARVAEVVDWMSLPEGERPDFVTLYFDEPDLQGHKSGPSNEEQVSNTVNTFTLIQFKTLFTDGDPVSLHFIFPGAI